MQKSLDHDWLTRWNSSPIGSLPPKISLPVRKLWRICRCMLQGAIPGHQPVTSWIWILPALPVVGYRVAVYVKFKSALLFYITTWWSEWRKESKRPCCQGPQYFSKIPDPEWCKITFLDTLNVSIPKEWLTPTANPRQEVSPMIVCPIGAVEIESVASWDRPRPKHPSMKSGIRLGRYNNATLSLQAAD